MRGVTPESGGDRGECESGERRRAAHAAHLATLRRVLIRMFPPNAPRAVVLLDVGRRDIQSFLVDEIEDARERIARSISSGRWMCAPR